MAGTDREKALDTALAQIERQFGKGAVMRMGDRSNDPIEIIPTGSTALDVALGVGGLPRGRVVEVYGPESSGKTTLTLHAVANAQRSGGTVAFVDAEHALDPEYARKLGVDVDQLILSQPDNGEQALEITDMLIRSGALDLIVIDSVAALVPRAEIEGEMGDSHVGLQARLMSQALRKITGALHQSKTTAIFINQLREKVGVMFGCFPYDTPVTLADGTREEIGALVARQADVEVLSYDPEADRMVPRRITDWFDNGEAERFLRLTVATSAGEDQVEFEATENHLIRTPGGWREAGELIAGDRVLIAERTFLGPQQEQLVLGALMGGGELLAGPQGKGVRFRMEHPREQAAYLDWKVSLLENLPSRSTGAEGPRGTVAAEFPGLPELEELRQVVYLGGATKHITEEHLKAVTPLALAVWYMDCGLLRPGTAGEPGEDAPLEIAVGALSEGSRERVADHLRATYGLEARLIRTGPEQEPVLRLEPASAGRFQALVAPYVHPSLDSRLLPCHRGRFEVRPEFVEAAERLVPSQLLSVGVSPRTTGMRKFDIEVGGTHNYFVDGVMVHNSPETTTGGRALKFYASVRLDIRRIETLKDGTDAVGNRTRVKVVKNKVAPPFKQAEFDILYGMGISREGGLIDMGVEHGFIRKSGAWYTYEGDQLGQGKENARNFLRDNPDLADEVEKKIKEKLGIGVKSDASQTESTDGAAPATEPAAVPAPATKAPKAAKSTASKS